MTYASAWFKDNVISQDFFHTCAGKRLGEGVSRVVYECAWDKSVVFKFETADGQFANVTEWKIWEEVQYVDRIVDWFAPCVAISDNGKVLIQKRTLPIARDKLPTAVPKIFTDVKPSNWGLYKGKPVCHDYALNLAISHKINARLCKADWTRDASSFLTES